MQDRGQVEELPRTSGSRRTGVEVAQRLCVRAPRPVGGSHSYFVPAISKSKSNRAIVFMHLVFNICYKPLTVVSSLVVVAVVVVVDPYGHCVEIKMENVLTCLIIEASLK